MASLAKQSLILYSLLRSSSMSFNFCSSVRTSTFYRIGFLIGCGSGHLLENR
jgi:hypothetical protein